jgi:pre-mRNA-processing factor 6
VARLFARDRKIDKARKWFERAVALNSKLGDAWAHYYIFEVRQRAISQATGDDKRIEDIINRTVAAAPNRGELWCEVAKRTDMRHADPAAVLRHIAEEALLHDVGSGGTMNGSGPITASSASVGTDEEER